MLLLRLAGAAYAAYPDNVDLTAMTDFGGEAVFDEGVLANSYRQLVGEIGTVVANKVAAPAGSLGLYGFDVDVGAQFALTEGRFRADGVSPWARASASETSPPYRVVPTVTVRKGLPLSSEVGATFGWISGTSTGFVGGFARVSVLDGFRPLPDVALHIGYSGYVGNNQLDVGALDYGVTIGTTVPVGRLAKVNTGKVSPFASISSVRVRANPTIDPEIEDAIGAVRYSRPTLDADEVVEPPIGLPMVGLGVQLVAGATHVKVAAAWAPATIPTVTAGFGFTY